MHEIRKTLSTPPYQKTQRLAGFLMGEFKISLKPFSNAVNF